MEEKEKNKKTEDTIILPLKECLQARMKLAKAAISRMKRTMGRLFWHHLRRTLLRSHQRGLDPRHRLETQSEMCSMKCTRSWIVGFVSVCLPPSCRPSNRRGSFERSIYAPRLSSPAKSGARRFTNGKSWHAHASTKLLSAKDWIWSIDSNKRQEIKKQSFKMWLRKPKQKIWRLRKLIT